MNQHHAAIRYLSPDPSGEIGRVRNRGEEAPTVVNLTFYPATDELWEEVKRCQAALSRDLAVSLGRLA